MHGAVIVWCAGGVLDGVFWWRQAVSLGGGSSTGETQCALRLSEGITKMLAHQAERDRVIVPYLLELERGVIERDSLTVLSFETLG